MSLLAQRVDIRRAIKWSACGREMGEGRVQIMWPWHWRLVIRVGLSAMGVV